MNEKKYTLAGTANSVGPVLLVNKQTLFQSLFLILSQLEQLDLETFRIVKNEIEYVADVTVEEKEKIPFEEVKKFLPSSEEYTQNTAIQFHDEKDLRIQNCSAWHQKSRKNRTYIHDFLGQVFCMNSPVSIEGEVRIVPTDRSKFMNKEVQRRYPPCERGANPPPIKLTPTAFAARSIASATGT